MRVLSASELLAAWEHGWGQPPVQQALTLLAAAFPDAAPNSLAELNLDLRNSHLLALHEQIFGPNLLGLAICPQCRERLELRFRVDDIQGLAESEPPEALALEMDGYQVRFRLPNSLDLIAVNSHLDIDEARRDLLARCVLAADCQGETQELHQLPANVVAAMVDRMAQVGSLADVRLALTCPACSHDWEAIFDIASFLWSELNAWGQRILTEVHTLALAYGWREADSLALSPWRRQFYLAQIGSMR
jgi:hypothetical protein